MTEKIDDDVRDALSSMTWVGCSAHLQPIGRKLYVKVRKVIHLAGGQWDSQTQSHIFDQDGEEKIANAIATGEILDTKKEYQFYETPDWIAEKMVSCLFPKNAAVYGSSILEPSFGRGALIKALMDRGVAGKQITAVERNIDSFGKISDWLSTLGVSVFLGDFLKIEPGGEFMFDRIIMNPPFRLGQDVEHVTHAYSMLNPGGRLVSIMSPSWTFRTGAKYEAFRDLVANQNLGVEDIPAGAFKSSGTEIRTTMVVLGKL